MFNEEKYFDTEKLLDEALKTEPQFVLPDNFADKITKRLERKYAWQQYFREFLIYLGAIIGMLAVSVAIQVVFFDANWQKWIEMVVGNIWFAGGIMFLLMFVLFADRVLLRYFLFRVSAGQN